MTSSNSSKKNHQNENAIDRQGENSSNLYLSMLLSSLSVKQVRHISDSEKLWILSLWVTNASRKKKKEARTVLMAVTPY